MLRPIRIDPIFSFSITFANVNMNRLVIFITIKENL